MPRILPFPEFQALSSIVLLFAASVAAAGPVSFRNDVMAVLSKAGCNQGACHGNQNGKNGFKLSLRGQDPDFDLRTLTRELFGRRTDKLRPAESLVLRKATASVPHEGGKRFGTESLEYSLLAAWIAAGMPADSADTPALSGLEVAPREQVLVEPADRVQLHVQARFADGSTRDVTRLAVYETSSLLVSVSPGGEVRGQPGETAILVRYLDRQATVRLAFVPARPGFHWEAVPETNFIDHDVFAKLRTLRMQPSGLCSESVFLRRVYLDTLGILPTASEARAFLDDSRPDKRARLIEELLRRPEFADFWALKWSDLLRNEEKVLDRKGVRAFHDWLRDQIAEGVPLNEFARELLSARGSTYAEPAANYYRALRDPLSRAETTAQVFLGIRLQCARCHNHPFDRWTQDDYYGLAAFFPRVQYRILENNRRDNLDKHEFVGEQIVWQDRESEVTHPRTGAVVAPRFPGVATPYFTAEQDRLEALADWIARPDNPFFARAQVNRVWYHLMGRGIVDPNDDFRASNPPVNEELLNDLARDFAAHQFDLRYLVRTILNSRTYQLSDMPNDTNRDDETNFSHALPRPLQAEQLADALAAVTGEPVKFEGYPLGARAIQVAGVRGSRRPTRSEEFLRSFGKPERSLTCECERGEDSTLSQALQLISGELLNQMLTAKENRIGRFLDEGKSNAAIVEECYLSALNRRPTEEERRAVVGRIERARDRRAALEDFVWALVNSKEFLLRQ